MTITPEDLEYVIRNAHHINVVKHDAWNSCWAWKGPVLETHEHFNYSIMTRGKKSELGHRFFAELMTGNVKDLVVMHTCDNPNCVRPSHLKVGTQLDNVKDMIAKGRKQKLSAEDVRDIRKREMSGYAYGKKYNIDKTVIYDIWKGKLYKWVD